jgi:hypothetical protein
MEGAFVKLKIYPQTTMQELSVNRDKNYSTNPVVHRGVDFYVQNIVKFTYSHLAFPKIFFGLYPGPLKGEEGGERIMESKILQYALLVRMLIVNMIGVY